MDGTCLSELNVAHIQYIRMYICIDRFTVVIFEIMEVVDVATTASTAIVVVVSMSTIKCHTRKMQKEMAKCQNQKEQIWNMLCVLLERKFFCRPKK